MRAVSLAGALVGRDSGLATLSRLVKDAAAGRGGSALVEGEPGIGKSSLVREALADAADVGCQVFLGAGDELSHALHLAPLIEALGGRQHSVNPRRNTILGLLRGEVAAERGIDVSAAFGEQMVGRGAGRGG